MAVRNQSKKRRLLDGNSEITSIILLVSGAIDWLNEKNDEIKVGMMCKKIGT